jgi:hypothetical protein
MQNAIKVLKHYITLPGDNILNFLFLFAYIISNVHITLDDK